MQPSSTDRERSVDDEPRVHDQVPSVGVGVRYEVYSQVQVPSVSEESEARSMHDSMPDLATDSVSENENLLSPDSNETDSGNSELQWGDPQII